LIGANVEGIRYYSFTSFCEEQNGAQELIVPALLLASPHCGRFATRLIAPGSGLRVTLRRYCEKSSVDEIPERRAS